jgi:hypothetical protein
MTVNPISTGRIQNAIASASSATGVDFDYLLNQAKVESGLNANARAGTSSASGLYQFVEQSWLSVVKKHGAEHGLGWAADSIQQTSSGRYYVGDGATKSAILSLRNDPDAASLMAAEHASDNKDALEGTLGRSATGTDLYMAHFLGLGGAKKFLTTMASNPYANAAALFPAAAGSNRNVFYTPAGAPRSVSEVYDRFADKLGAGSGDLGAGVGPGVNYAAQTLNLDGSTVITGNNQSAADALTWATSALGKFAATANPTAAANLMRPTPDTARLAYLLLANLGG